MILVTQQRTAALAFVLLLAAGSPPTQATTFERLGLETLATLSTHVVRGQVLSAESAWNEDKSAIYTSARLRVDEAIAGKVPGKEIVVFVPGGRVGDTIQTVIGAPTLETGKDVVLMLSAADPSGFGVVGLSQGAFDLKRDPASGKTMAISQAAAFLPPIAAEETARSPTGAEGIPLEELIRTVREAKRETAAAAPGEGQEAEGREEAGSGEKEGEEGKPDPAAQEEKSEERSDEPAVGSRPAQAEQEQPEERAKPRAQDDEEEGKP